MKKENLFLTIFFIAILFGVIIMPMDVFAAEPGTFTDLQGLINSNTELVLDRDYVNSGSEGKIVISGKNIILDLNGHVINANRVSSAFNVINSKLTIKDSGSNVEHKFDVNDYLLATLNESNGTLLINGGCITGGNTAYNKYTSYYRFWSLS